MEVLVLVHRALVRVKGLHVLVHVRVIRVRVPLSQSSPELG